MQIFFAHAQTGASRFVGQQINHADGFGGFARDCRILRRAENIVVVLIDNHRPHQIVCDAMTARSRDVGLRLGRKRICARKTEHKDENDDDDGKEDDDQSRILLISQVLKHLGASPWRKNNEKRIGRTQHASRAGHKKAAYYKTNRRFFKPNLSFFARLLRIFCHKNWHILRELQ